MSPPFCANNMTDTQTTATASTTGPRMHDGSDASSEMMCNETPTFPSCASVASSRCALPSRDNDLSSNDCDRIASFPDSSHEGKVGANADVSEIVVKAKKAAASLWMILHAQVSFCWIIDFLLDANNV